MQQVTWLAVLVAVFMSVTQGVAQASGPVEVSGVQVTPTPVASASAKASDVQIYMEQVIPYLQQFSQAEMRWVKSHDALVKNPDLLNDASWQDQVNQNLDAMQQAAKGMADLNAPAGAKGVKKVLATVTKETSAFATDYKGFIKAMRAGNSDQAVTYRDQGVQHLGSLHDAIDELSTQFKDLGSSTTPKTK